MKFSVHIDGADTGLIERLTAAANRKLAPKLKRLAARHVRHAQASSHHALVRHPITGHAVTHRTKARRSGGCLTARMSTTHNDHIKLLHKDCASSANSFILKGCEVRHQRCAARKLMLG